MSKSPIGSFFSESLGGLVSIRTFKEENAFIKVNFLEEVEDLTINRNSINCKMNLSRTEYWSGHCLTGTT